jgi:hypothetical protein
MKNYQIQAADGPGDTAVYYADTLAEAREKIRAALSGETITKVTVDSVPRIKRAKKGGAE